MGLWAAAIASRGITVHFVGASENPRNHQETWRPWITRLLDLEGITTRSTGMRLDYEWRGVECICVPQSEILDTTRALLRTDADLLWTSQEDCDGIAALANEIPVVSYAHSVTSVGLLSAAIRPRFLLAPSHFVQQTIRTEMGVHSHLVRPVLDDFGPAECSLAGRSTVLFINPIPEKGLALVLTLARSLPHVRFVFVEAWQPVGDESKSFPDNVLLLPRQPNLQMQYARARLVVVPSTVPDAAPRVISEAGKNGIPVLGSTSGGIPEYVANPSVNCIPTSDPDKWLARMAQLLSDDLVWTQAAIAQQQFTDQILCDPYSSLAKLGIVPPV